MYYVATDMMLIDDDYCNNCYLETFSKSNIFSDTRFHECNETINFQHEISL